MKNNNLFTNIPTEQLKKRKKIAQPNFIQPMLATLTSTYFSKPDWIYEHKFDGERCLAFKQHGKVRLISRNDKEMNRSYPELVTALEKQAADNFIIDGEIVSMDAQGNSDFELLQSRMNLRKGEKVIAQERIIHIAYCIFDIIYIDGYDVRILSLLNRKEILKRSLNYNKTLVYAQHKVNDGIPFFKEACKLGWEGLIAKKSDSEYVGKRSTNWLKFKCIMKQELVIGGYTEPKGSRDYFGALLVGYYDKQGELQYAGKVGTGYSEETLTLLGKKLKKLALKTCPFSNYDGKTTGVHWVKPVLVAEFQFAQWTKANKLRVGRYKGLRDDKNAKDVVQETPKAIGPH